MSFSLVGRRGGKRVLLWGRACGRVPLVIFLALVLFLAGLALVVGVTEHPLFETWWVDHLWVLLLGFVGLALAACVGWPLAWGLRAPLDRLPDLDVLPGTAPAETVWGLFRTWRYYFAALALTGFGLFFYAEENWRGERAWERYKQESAAHGEPLEFAAIVPRRVPDERNFAMTPFLAPLFGYLPGTQQARDTNGVQNAWNFAPRFNAASNWVKPAKVPRSNSWTSARLDLPTWHGAFLKGTNASRGAGKELLSTKFTLLEAGTGVLGALAECEPVIEELREASRLPYSRFNLGYDSEIPAGILLPHLGLLKRICQMLQLRASAELALGRTEAAFEDVSLMLRLTDALREEPFLISHMVRIGQLQLALQPLAEGLARHQWSEAQLRAIQEQLRHFDFLSGGRRALYAEQVCGGAIIDYLRRSPNRLRAFQNMGGFGTGQQSDFGAQELLLAAAPSGWFYFEQLHYSRMFAEHYLPGLDVSGHRVSPGTCREAEAHLEALAREPWPVLLLRHRCLSGLLLPSLSGAIRKTGFAQTGAELAAVGCALERYRLAHGQFPDALDSLAPQFMDKLPRDVINGQALKYRRTEDGQYLLYSVGWNETDDGGAVRLTGSGESVDLETGDWVWRLPSSSVGE